MAVIVKLAAGTISLTPVSSKAWQSTQVSILVGGVPRDRRVTLRHCPVTHEDLEVQRDESDLDKAVPSQEEGGQLGLTS